MFCISSCNNITVGPSITWALEWRCVVGSCGGCRSQNRYSAECLDGTCVFSGLKCTNFEVISYYYSFLSILFIVVPSDSSEVARWGVGCIACKSHFPVRGPYSRRSTMLPWKNANQLGLGNDGGTGMLKVLFSFACLFHIVYFWICLLAVL